MIFSRILCWCNSQNVKAKTEWWGFGETKEQQKACRQEMKSQIYQLSRFHSACKLKLNDSSSWLAYRIVSQNVCQDLEFIEESTTRGAYNMCPHTNALWWCSCVRLGNNVRFPLHVLPCEGSIFIPMDGRYVCNEACACNMVNKCHRNHTRHRLHSVKSAKRRKQYH